MKGEREEFVPSMAALLSAVVGGGAAVASELNTDLTAVDVRAIHAVESFFGIVLFREAEKSRERETTIEVETVSNVPDERIASARTRELIAWNIDITDGPEFVEVLP